MILRTTAVWLCGALTGAALVFLLDPTTRGRRTRVRDRARSELRRAERGAERRARYEEGRLRRLQHAASEGARLTDHALPDFEATLIDKVRSEAFRGRHAVLAHVNLNAEDGVVHVRGAVADQDEAADLLDRVRGVEGVRDVVDHLTIARRNGAREPRPAPGLSATNTPASGGSPVT